MPLYRSSGTWSEACTLSAGNGFSLKKPLFCLLLSYQSEEREKIKKLTQSRDKGRRGSHPNPGALPSHRVEA